VQKGLFQWDTGQWVFTAQHSSIQSAEQLVDTYGTGIATNTLLVTKLCPSK
jgi:hypothetical protein